MSNIKSTIICTEIRKGELIFTHEKASKWIDALWRGAPGKKRDFLDFGGGGGGERVCPVKRRRRRLEILPGKEYTYQTGGETNP